MPQNTLVFDKFQKPPKFKLKHSKKISNNNEKMKKILPTQNLKRKKSRHF